MSKNAVWMFSVDYTWPILQIPQVQSILMDPYHRDKIVVQ